MSEFTAEFIQQQRAACDDACARFSRAVDEVVQNYPAALDEIERLREAQRWIPVSERLPKIGERVIVYLANGWTGIACWFQMYTRKNGDPLWRNDSGAETHNVTHWMPLPEPQQEAEG